MHATCSYADTFGGEAACLRDMRQGVRAVRVPGCAHADTFGGEAGCWTKLSNRECLAARLTDMRLLPRMRPHVYPQATRLGERLAACLADMRLLLCYQVLSLVRSIAIRPKT